MMEFMRGTPTYYRGVRKFGSTWSWVGPVYYNSTDAANYLNGAYPSEVGTGSLKVLAMQKLEDGEKLLQDWNEKEVYTPTQEDLNRWNFVRWLRDTRRAYVTD